MAERKFKTIHHVANNTIDTVQVGWDLNIGLKRASAREETADKKKMAGQEEATVIFDRGARVERVAGIPRDFLPATIAALSRYVAATTPGLSCISSSERPKEEGGISSRREELLRRKAEEGTARNVIESYGNCRGIVATPFLLRSRLPSSFIRSAGKRRAEPSRAESSLHGRHVI